MSMSLDYILFHVVIVFRKIKQHWLDLKFYTIIDMQTSVQINDCFACCIKKDNKIK